MDKFITVKGIAAPLDRANVDTDQIIPKQFLKSIKRTGFGPNLFDEWRYLDEGQPGEDCSQRPINKEFVLNDARYKGAKVLLARDNFGCGSSREHAPWALLDYGFQCVIAPSFADIFFNNCFKNGMLPLVLDVDIIDRMFLEVQAEEGYELEVDLQEQRVVMPNGDHVSFEVDSFRRHCLLNGLDDIGLTLQDADSIKSYEKQRQVSEPWIFNAIK